MKQKSSENATIATERGVNTEPESACPRCKKLPPHCMCASLEPVSSKLNVLILQHPREQKQPLNSAFIPALTLPHCAVRVGLSWPNLSKAWGSPSDPKSWIALFIGKRGVRALPGEILTVVNKKSEPHPERSSILRQTRGVIVLDGTWAEAKTLWWRNAWLSKVPRAVLKAPEPRRYGGLRRAARSEGVSTAEAVAWSIEAILHDADSRTRLLSYLDLFLDTFRSSTGGSPQ